MTYRASDCGMYPWNSLKTRSAWAISVNPEGVELGVGQMEAEADGFVGQGGQVFGVGEPDGDVEGVGFDGQRFVAVDRFSGFVQDFDLELAESGVGVDVAGFSGEAQRFGGDGSALESGFE